MSASVISAREGALAKGADAVATARSSLLESTSRVQASLGQLGGAWRGSAASTYTELLQRWSNDAAALAEVLTELENALGSTSTDQAAQEQLHTHAIRDLRSIMGVD